MRFWPWTPNPDPLLAPKFSRDVERPGIDNPPELIFLKLPPPTMFPIEFVVIRGPAFPNSWDIPIGTLFRLPSPGEVERIPGIEPAPPLALLLKPGLPTLIPPLFGIPECPCELLWDNYKTITEKHEICILREKRALDVLTEFWSTWERGTDRLLEANLPVEKLTLGCCTPGDGILFILEFLDESVPWRL